jgi:hypothetical protein
MKNLLFKIVGIFGLIMMFVPGLFEIGGLTAMSGFITAGSEYNGKETLDIFTRKLKETMLPAGIRIVNTDKAASVKLTFFDAITKVLMPYASGFQGGSGANVRQKKFILAEFKAEVSYSKQDYKTIIQTQLLDHKGDNDIAGTKVMTAEQEIFSMAVNQDIVRNFWLGDTSKIHLAAGTYPDGSTTYAIGDVNKYYNVINGIWTSLIAAAAPYASATNEQIRRITVVDGAVAQTDFRTLTIANGTITVTYKGKAFSEAFDTNATTTVTNFVASHAADIKLLGITVTDEGTAILKAVSDRAGVSLAAVYAASTGSWATSGGTQVANVAPVKLATDEAIGYLSDMFYNSSVQLRKLRSMDNSPLKFHLTQDMIDNYEQTLSDMTVEIPETYYNTINGIRRLTYKGIPIIPMMLDEEIAADFEGQYQSRGILTIDNQLCLVLSEAGSLGETSFWFNNDENQNRQRTQFEMGADFYLPEYITVLY